MPRVAQPKLSRAAVLKSIDNINRDIRRAEEYLSGSALTTMRGLRPLSVRKRSGGKDLPPHKDWVRNVYLRGRKKALIYAEKLLERLG